MIDVWKSYINLYIRSQCADPGPPLGTVLGNLGVNSVKFCKDFNEFTQDLPDYLVLSVHIYIRIDRSFFFRIFEPSFNNLLSLLVRYDSVTDESYLLCDDLIKLANFKLASLPLEKSLFILFSSIKRRNLKVYD